MSQTHGAEAPSSRKVIMAGLIGNVMEWYDFAVYGYFASIIGAHFFPSEDPAVSLIAAFGAFAAGFVVRPLGGLVFGRIGDLVGRKKALTLSVVAMAVPTVLIAFLPTYESVGILAPILIVTMRVVQGLSVGGEFTSSLVFLTERAAPNRRAFTAVWGTWGAVAGILLGSAIGGLAAGLLGEEELRAWGWRVPFVLGGLVAVTGLVLRAGIQVDAPSHGVTNPLRDTFGRFRWPVLRVMLLNVANGVGFYIAFVYAATYATQIDKISEELALNLNSSNMLILLVLLPVSAYFADRIGRKPLMIAGAAVLALGAVPLFMLLHHPDPLMIFLGELGFGLGMALFGGGVAAANVELIPAPARCTGLAFAYNAAIGLLGGTTPMIAAWLIASTGDPVSPSYWVAGASLVTLIALITVIPETLERRPRPVPAE